MHREVHQYTISEADYAVYKEWLNDLDIRVEGMKVEATTFLQGLDSFKNGTGTIPVEFKSSSDDIIMLSKDDYYLYQVWKMENTRNSGLNARYEELRKLDSFTRAVSGTGDRLVEFMGPLNNFTDMRIARGGPRPLGCQLNQNHVNFLQNVANLGNNSLLKQMMSVHPVLKTIPTY